MAILLGGLTLAATRSETVQRFFRDIKIELNGTEIIPKDVTGKVVEPFIIDGTTYLPVRTVGEALGLYVGWEEENNKVILSKEPIQEPTVTPTQTPTVKPTKTPVQKVDENDVDISKKREERVNELISKTILGTEGERYDTDDYTLIEIKVDGMPHGGYSRHWYYVRNDGSYEDLGVNGYKGANYPYNDAVYSNVALDIESGMVKCSSGDEELIFDLKTGTYAK